MNILREFMFHNDNLILCCSPYDNYISVDTTVFCALNVDTGYSARAVCSVQYHGLLNTRPYMSHLMIILLEKVAPVPLFTDNFQRIFTIRRYHPRCEDLT